MPEFSRVRIEALAAVQPPRRVSSDEIEERLAPVYERLKLPQGRLELMTGIRARHFWNTPVLASEASAQAGKAVLEKTRFGRDEFDLLVHAGVCRDRLEPATAAFVHQHLGLSGRAQIFDVSNACLGFANSMLLAGGLIESGQIERALVVSGEDGWPLLERTIQTLLNGDFTRKTIKPYFANLTIGAGAAAMVLCRDDLAPDAAPKLRGGVIETDSSHNHLCQGDRAQGGDGLEMLTEAEQLLEAGLGVAERAWAQFKDRFGWDAAAIDRFVCHQVGRTHQRRLFEVLGLDHAKDFTTFEEMGNVGSVSLPLTLTRAHEAGVIQPGGKVAMLGIGSGLSSMMLAVEW